jgi:hypothetical protein
MVDYYALISPTIEPLADASPEERKVVYDRLVVMLDQQLRAADPPRSDKDILKERINLEAAIRRVERRIMAEKKRVQETPRPADTNSFADVTPPLNQRSEPRSEARQAPVNTDQSPVSEIGSLPKASLPGTRWPATALPETTWSETTRPEATGPETGLSETNWSDTANPIPDDLPKDDGVLVASESVAISEPHETVETVIEFQPDQAREDRNDNHPISGPDPEAYEQPSMEERGAPVDRGVDARPAMPSVADLQRMGSGLSTRAKGLWLRIGIIGLVILALAAAIGGLADYLAERSTERLAVHTPSQQAETATTEQKLTDRLPVAPDEKTQGTAANDAAAQSQTDTGKSGDQDLMIQRAILLEEAPGGVGDLKRTTGRVTWKLETGKSSGPQASVIEVKASIDLAEAGLTATVVFKRNRDQTSANTHLIEITMAPQPDNPNGKVRDVSVPEMWVDEKTRSGLLAGIAVPVSDNVFLIGLNGLPADMQRNVDLLRSRNWIMIPMRYANGKRALLLFEKGKPGERIFEDAMQAWQ